AHRQKFSLNIFMVIPSGLPQHLDLPSPYQLNPFKHTSVDAASPQTSTNYKDGRKRRIQPKFGIGLLQVEVLSKSTAYRVTGKYYLFGREKALHLRIGNANSSCLFGKDTVGHPGKTVLLLQDSRNSRSSSGP